MQNGKKTEIQRKRQEIQLHIDIAQGILWNIDSYKRRQNQTENGFKLNRNRMDMTSYQNKEAQKLNQEML